MAKDNEIPKDLEDTIRFVFKNRADMYSIEGNIISIVFNNAEETKGSVTILTPEDKHKYRKFTITEVKPDNKVLLFLGTRTQILERY